MDYLKLLINKYSEIIEAIRNLNREYDFDDNQINAYLTLTNITIALTFSAQLPDYVPADEFDSLIESIEKLTDSSDEPLLKQLITTLIAAGTLLEEKDSRTIDDRLTRLEKILQDLPDSLFKEITITSATKLTHLLSSTLKKPVTLSLAKKQIAIVHTPQEKSIDDLIKEYNNHKLKIEDLIIILQSRFEKSTNKEEFIKHLIIVCRELTPPIDLIKPKTQYNYRHYRNQSIGPHPIKELFIHLRISSKEIDAQIQSCLLKEFIKNNFDFDDQKHYENSRNRDQLDRFFEKERTKIGLHPKESEFSKMLYNFVYLNTLTNLANLAAVEYRNSLSTPLVIPPTVQFLFYIQEPLEKKALKEFVTSVYKINNKAPTHQKRNLVLFFSRHHNTLLQLAKIMGIKISVDYMQNHIANTIIPLERLFDTIPVLPSILQNLLQKYFYAQLVLPKPDFIEINMIKDCIIVLGILNEISYQSNQVLDEKNYWQLSLGKPPKIFLMELIKILLNKIFQEAHIQLNEQVIFKIIETINAEQFVKLAAASQRMQDEEYRNIFLHLLKYDLGLNDDNTDSVDNFLHNPLQTNLIGSDLAKHNQAIRKTLNLHDINPEQALNYPEILEFIVLPSESTETNKGNLLLVLWSYLAQLKLTALEFLTNTQCLDSKNSKRVKPIVNAIEQLEKFIKKQNDSNNNLAIINALNKDHAKTLINKIATNIEVLHKEKVKISTRFNEFSGHCREQIKLIQKIKFKANEKLALHHFSVEQWSKNNKDTFFLGEYVGCCLAPTNSQFPAMVQRRLDDGLSFFVLRDKATEKPAALIWLYLAETAANTCVLMANFFEVNTKFALNPATRLAILNGLLLFTHQYLQDNPNIAGFYMNKLRYGWNINDLQAYPIVPLVLKDKMGGPYIPHIEWAEEEENEETTAIRQSLTKDKYYLVSLEEQDFHQFDPQILCAALNTSSNLITKNALIQRTVAELHSNETDINALVSQVSQRCRLELEPFYSVPLASDPLFKQDVLNAWQKIQTSKVAPLTSLQFDFFRAKPSVPTAAAPTVVEPIGALLNARVFI